MGLFDAYQFDGYGGMGGGLLDIFRMMQSVPQNQPGFDQTNNEPSRLDGAQWPTGPMGAPVVGLDAMQRPTMQQQGSQLPPQAQPTQGQMQMPPPIGVGDRLSAGLHGFANSGAPLPAISNLISGLMTGQRSDPFGVAMQQQNQTERALRASGFDANLSKVVSRDPSLLRTVLPELMGFGGKTADIKEYQFAKKEDPSLTFERFMARKKAVSGEYGMQPIYGTNARGETVVLQLGKSGDAKQSVMPPGVKLSTGVEKIDLGTEWGIIDKKTGTMVGRQPKDIIGKESQEEVGKDQGLARAALPAAEISAKRSLEKIDQFMEHEGFSEVFGALNQFRPNWTMSGKGRDALARFKQLSGEAFLEGRTMLKGGGAITDFESAKAEAAIARLERSLNEEEAKAALNDFKDSVRAGLEKLRARAGSPQRIRLNADGTIKQ